MSYLQVFKRQINRVKYLAERQKTRRQLRTLNDEALADVGISREVAQAESTKPFWR